MLQGNMRYLFDPICKFYNIIQSSIGTQYYHATNKEEYQLLKRNKSLYHIHQGEKCFILGNGPSLKTCNFNLLQGQIVMSVNQAFREQSICDLNPKYHFWMDENFFDSTESPGAVELRKIMKKTAFSPETISFYPIAQRKYVLERIGAKNENLFFLNPRLRLYDSYSSKCKLETFIPYFGTVVQYAVFVAIYMGFKEIYLLGCDSTGIVSTLNAALKTENPTYMYQVSKNEKQRMEAMVDNSNVIDYAYTYYCSLKGYEILYKYCKRNGIKFVNCSSSSVLDMLPKSTLENVMKGK